MASNPIIRIDRKQLRPVLEPEYLSALGSKPTDEEVNFFALKLESDIQDSVAGKLTIKKIRQLHKDFVRDELPKLKAKSDRPSA